MKKLKKLLKSIENLFKERVAAFKQFVREWKKDNRYRAQLTKGLLVLDGSGDNVKAGLYLYDIYRYGSSEDGRNYSPIESLKMALRKVAEKTNTENKYDEALGAALVPIRKPVRKSFKPVSWRAGHVVAAILAILVVLWLVFLLSYNDRENNNPTKIVSSDIPACQTWMMEAAPFETADNKLYADGLQMIQDAKLGKSSENDQKALEALQTYRNKKVYLLDIAQSELSSADWAKVNPDEISDTGSCANKTTNELYQAVIFEVIHSSVSIENLPAPSTWYNSGIVKGQIVVDGQKGVSGNLKALVIRHRDGRVTAYLARCGNPVHKSQEGRHKGDTDEHHHKPVCTNNCTPLTPKSSNINDYQRPGTDNTKDSGTGTKPKVTVSTPPESTPPAVLTSKSGGGGVVDTPTSKPGSETGVKAPGASPAPTTPPAPKPNEGGSNNGVVTD